MNKIIWNDAPDDATHYNTKNDLFYRFNSRGDCEYWAYFAWVETSTTLQDYAGHWVEKPFVWTGDGLPPVGVEVEWHECQQTGWQRVTVLAYHGDEAWIAPAGKPSIVVGNPANFRPIRTPEQIAEEERNAAYKGMLHDLAAVLGISNIDERECDVLHALVDAGYRKAGDV
ncbi:hypothetical protein [Metapseudomonas otitidis]|uniref:hypothetical protein n=1 Tax=Metapseudomonas otitidis TaxID=319939 RepID=UPI0024492093|nr:hypothetical protein [Pseudomonas otitidis]MDG9785249.1 hypothetical protein [Pseudomonas otitidis]